MEISITYIPNIYPVSGLGHAYFIAFYALKNKAKIRELKYPVSNAGSNADPPAGLSFVPAHILSVTLLSESKLKEIGKF